MAWKKFVVGDQVFFKTRHYLVHNDHRGEILSITTRPKIRNAGTVVSYEIKCECGSILHPAADHLSSLHFGDPQNGGNEKPLSINERTVHLYEDKIMTQYDLNHPKCGAEWKATYYEFPNEVQCIKCGEFLKSVYYPRVTVVRPYSI